MLKFPFHSYILEQYQIGETEYQEQTDAVTDNYLYRLINKQGNAMRFQGASNSCWSYQLNRKRYRPSVSKLISECTGTEVNAVTYSPPRLSKPRLKPDGLHGIYALRYRGEQMTGDSSMQDDCLYIGESKDVQTRFKQHMYDARTGKKVAEARYPLDRVWKRIIKRGGLDSIEQFLLVELPPVPTWTSFQNRKLREAVETYFIHKWSVTNGKVDELTEEPNQDIYFYDLNVKQWQVPQDQSNYAIDNLTAYLQVSTSLPDSTVTILKSCLSWWDEQASITGNW